MGNFYWSVLNEVNKISLLVKSIDIENKSTIEFWIYQNNNGEYQEINHSRTEEGV